MGVSDELEYLKSLVSKLSDKIRDLESQKDAPGPKTPARQLRTILIGPPGAGKKGFASVYDNSGAADSMAQAREPRRLEYGTNFAFVIWQLATCCVNKSSRKPLLEWRRRKSWMQGVLFQMISWLA